MRLPEIWAIQVIRVPAFHSTCDDARPLALSGCARRAAFFDNPDSTTMSTLERAISIAALAHAGQVDKAGQPYFLSGGADGQTRRQGREHGSQLYPCSPGKDFARLKEHEQVRALLLSKNAG